MSTDPLVRSIDPNAVRHQLKRRGPAAVAAHPLWQEAAVRLEDRLSYIRAPEGVRLDYGIAQFGQPITAAPGSLGMVVSVGLLAYLSDQRSTLAYWAKTLAPGGLLMFCTLGPDSFRSLAVALEDHDQSRHGAGYPDMHDIGDALVSFRMANPVMDVEWLKLTYADPESALRDLRLIGGNPMFGRGKGLRGRTWRDRVLLALASLERNGRIEIPIELVFGHAWAASATRPSKDQAQPIQWFGKTPKDSGSNI
jgi:malonyl-CoA O-methyltransferase